MVEQPADMGRATGMNLESITRALEDPKYVWRTPEGLSKDTGLPAPAVLTMLAQIPHDVLVSTTGPQGHLYTTRRHYNQRQSFFGKLLSAMSGKLK